MKKLKNLLMVLIIILLGVLQSSNVLANEKVNTNNENIKNNKNYSSAYSKAYLEYLELSDEEKSKIKVIPRKYNIPLDSIYEEKKPSIFNLFALKSDANTNSEETSELPEKFDLRDEINIATKDQDKYGLCWAFASIRSLETNLLLNGYGDYDFSEWHLAYTKKNGFGYEIDENSGGSFYEFEEYAAQNYGPTLESNVPYAKKYTEEQFEYLYDLEGIAYIQKTIDFPTIDKIYETYTDEQLNLFREKVKKHIMENGSIYSSIDSYSINNINEKNTLYSSNEMADHAVSVIGWDDTFSKENFEDKDGNKPSKDGAYIVLNSWGENTEIIYVSYEDFLIEREMSGIIDATTKQEEAIKSIKFKDKNLYEAIKKQLGRNVIEFKDDDMEIKCINSDAITNLDLSWNKISNIEGLENFTNLKEIDLDFNDITDISPIWNIKNLNIIHLKNNKIEDLGNISSMPNLTCLELADNLISNISKISVLTNLQELNLEKNKLDSASGVEKLEKLTNLNIASNKISDINFIKSLTNLEYIQLTNNSIEDVSVFENLKITENGLDLSGNPIKTGIDKLSNISSITLDRCNLDNSIIDVLSNFKKLKSISLRYNNITDVSGLQKLKLDNSKLYNLDLSGNKNIELNTIPLDLVETLVLEDCNIEDVSIFKNFKGYHLDISSNPIEDLSPLKDIEISSINLSYTNITDVSSLNKISDIDLSENENLTGLDKLSSVMNLRLDNCNISEVSAISNLTTLKNLYIRENNISNIDVLTNLTNLEYLDAGFNKIENIPEFSKSPNLYNIDLIYNKITNIDNLTKWLPEGLYIDLDSNCISEIPDSLLNNYNIWVYGQSVDINITSEENKDNKIKLPNIIKKAYEDRYKNWPHGYENQTKIETDNCTVDFVNNEIIINPNELEKKNATIEIIGGEHGGTEYRILYNGGALEVELTDYKEEAEGEITYISDITPNTEISKIEENIETNGEIKIYKGTEEIIEKNSKIATGMTLKITLNNKTKEYIVVVTGDLNGDGQMNDIDVLMMARYKAKLYDGLKGEYLRASDIVKNGVYSEDTDLLKMARVLAKLDEL